MGRYLGMEYIFENRDRVRDYECDLQGIVNNANYQHYFEHSRHLYIISRGVTFDELHERGIDVVVARYEAAYKVPLRVHLPPAAREGRHPLCLPPGHLPRRRQQALLHGQGRLRGHERRPADARPP